MVNSAQSFLPELVLENFDIDLELVSMPKDLSIEDSSPTFFNLLTNKTNESFEASRTIECVAAKRAGFGALSQLLAKKCS